MTALEKADKTLPWFKKIWNSLQWMGGCLGIALITVLLWFGKLSGETYATLFIALATLMYGGRNATKYIYNRGLNGGGYGGGYGGGCGYGYPDYSDPLPSGKCPGDQP